jgi:hypothetical protein
MEKIVGRYQKFNPLIITIWTNFKNVKSMQHRHPHKKKNGETIPKKKWSLNPIKHQLIGIIVISKWYNIEYRIIKN